MHFSNKLIYIFILFLLLKIFKLFFLYENSDVNSRSRRDDYITFWTSFEMNHSGTILIL